MLRRRYLAVLALSVLAAGCGPSEPTEQETVQPQQQTAPAGPSEKKDVEPDKEMPLAEPDDEMETGDPELIEPQGGANAGGTGQAPNTAQAEPAGRDDATAVVPAKAEPEEPTTLEGRFEKSITLIQAQDFDGAQKYLEQVIAEDPKHRQGNLFLAAVYRAQGAPIMEGDEPEKALPLFRKAIAILRALKTEYGQLDSPEQQVLAGSLYFEARVLARGDKPLDAIPSLREAGKSGLLSPAFLDQDPQLEPLRELAEFKQLRRELVESSARAVLDGTEPFDFDFSLPDLDGKTVKLADYSGKVLIVDIWGTWCPPCREEVPHFVELHKKYRTKGLEIVGLNEETQGGASLEEAPAVVKEFAKKFGITYTCLIVDDKTLSQVPEFGGFPTTLFVDRKGKVRGKVEGYHPLEELEAIITLLLNEQPGNPVQEKPDTPAGEPETGG